MNITTAFSIYIHQFSIIIKYNNYNETNFMENINSPIKI